MKSQYNNKFLRTNDDIFVQNTNNTQLSVDNDRQMTIMDYMDISHVDLGALGIDDIDKLDSFLHSLRTLARDVEDKKNDLEYEKAEKERREEEKRRKEVERQRLLEEERQRIEAERKHNEHVKNVTSMELSLDWNNIFNNSPLTEGVYAESIPDGYVKCLNNLGRVDIEYIASITGADYKTVIQALYVKKVSFGENRDVNVTLEDESGTIDGLLQLYPEDINWILALSRNNDKLALAGHFIRQDNGTMFMDFSCDTYILSRSEQ